VANETKTVKVRLLGSPHTIHMGAVFIDATIQWNHPKWGMAGKAFQIRTSNHFSMVYVPYLGEESSESASRNAL